MPIITLQRRQTEVGRIRIGELVDGTGRNGQAVKRPSKRSSFLFTTESEKLAGQIAELYEGVVEPWEPNGGGPKQWKVDTKAKALAVIVPPNSVSQWYELWSGGGCTRRCDGERNVLTDKPCLCPADPVDRAELAANGKACKPTTRINVMLAQAKGAGVWRLETHGFYAATELPAVAELLAMGGGYIEGRLELQERSAKRPKARGDGMETRRWMVPVLHIDATPQMILQGQARMAIGSGDERPAAGPQAVASRPDQPALPAAPDSTRDDEFADEMGEATAHETAEHYRLIASNARTLAEVQTAWRDAKAAGVLDADLAAYLRKAGDALAPKAEAKPDAEPPIEADANEPSADEVWLAIVSAAGNKGWSMPQVEERVIARFNKSSDELNGWQLTEFLNAIKSGEVS